MDTDLGKEVRVELEAIEKEAMRRGGCVLDIGRIRKVSEREVDGCLRRKDLPRDKIDRSVGLVLGRAVVHQRRGEVFREIRHAFGDDKIRGWSGEVVMGI